MPVFNGIETPADGRAIHRHVPQHFPVDPIYRRVDGIAQSGGALHDRVKDRLHVRRRARNDAENVRCRRLLLQRLLRLIEQPHILDGDDGLVGKGLEEQYLAIGEWLRLLTE